MSSNDTNFSYYHEYCRLYLANIVLLSQMRQLVNERNEISYHFEKLEKRGEQIQLGARNEDQRKKRFRRTANQIERHYRCPVDTCQKSYGSQGSLNQHIKIKHHQFYVQNNIGHQDQFEGHDESKITESLISHKYHYLGHNH